MPRKSVIIDFTSGTDPYRVFGGLSDSGEVLNNTVALKNGNVTDNVYGGYSDNTNQAVFNSVFFLGRICRRNDLWRILQK
jgi:hypothetical protein